MRPNVSRAWRTAASTSAVERTSTSAVMARRPAFFTSSATASSPRQLPVDLVATTLMPVAATSVSTRSQPSVANRRAMARPKPCSPPLPVIMATLPRRAITNLLMSGMARHDSLGLP